MQEINRWQDREYIVYCRYVFDQYFLHFLSFPFVLSIPLLPSPAVLVATQSYNSPGIPLPKPCVSVWRYMSSGTKRAKGATMMVILEQCSARCA